MYPDVNVNKINGSQVVVKARYTLPVFMACVHRCQKRQP